MKIKTILVILLLMSFSLIFASEDSAETEHWEKVRQLDQLAERFKAETGFRGNIQSSTERMRLSHFEGKFADIQITADADTSSFRAAFERILDKVLPYTYARREQLTRSKITNNLGIIETVYCQQVNGYLVEGAGKIFIAYETGRNGFAIGNGTVDLSSSIEDTVISEKEAEQIALKDKGNEHDISAKVYNLFYSKEGSDFYYLAYFIVVTHVSSSSCEYFDYWIDALTGQIKKSGPSAVYNSDIEVIVKGNYYGSTSDWNSINNTSAKLGIQDARVYIANSNKQTDCFGHAIIRNVNYSTPKVKLINRYYWMTTRTNSDTLETDTFVADQNLPDQYHVDFPDASNGITHYAPNAFVVAHDQIEYLLRLKSDYFGNSINIKTAYPINNDDGRIRVGQYIPSTKEIRLKDARVHSVVRHELSHHFVHRYVGVMMGSMSQPATDEGLANYFGGASCNDAIIPNIGGAINLSHVIWISSSSTTNEDSYIAYDFGIPLASAWWSLRGNRYFPPDTQGINGVDTLLVYSLRSVKNEIPDNDAYRYKPRYFYNILMRRVDTDGASWPLNDKQLAINKAYNDRGFHFYPTVESIAHPTNPIAQNFYNPGDSVYVHIKNCPQNTIVGVRVVADNNTYNQIGVDGGPLPSAVITASKNSVKIDVTTDSNGEWKGFITYSNMLSPGEYDIIVDVGSPTTPDNTLNLVFAKDNIIDAVDGLDGAGFTVTNLGDAVVALDLSSSMDGCSMQLAKTVQAIEMSMLDNDDIAESHGDGILDRKGI